MTFAVVLAMSFAFSMIVVLVFVSTATVITMPAAIVSMPRPEFRYISSGWPEKI
jgi:hypothetical protein